MMTSRERVQTILDHKMPDRVAIDIGSTASGLTDPTMKRVKDYFHITSEDIVFRPDESASRYNDDVLEALGSDFRHVFLMPPEGADWSFDENGHAMTDWGIQKTMKTNLAQNSSCPLANADSIDDLRHYPWPDPYAPGRDRGINDMMINKEYANYLLDKILDIQMAMYDVLLTPCGEYVQMVETADDYGTQRGPMMSPELFEEMILPRRKKLNDFIRSKAPHAKIFHHTCGSVYRLLPDILETGVDVLNPVQPSAADMDTYRLAEEFGDKVIFHGSIDEQTGLVYGKDVVRKQMKERVESLGKNGGYIMAPTSNFQDDMPLENIVNFAKWGKEIGDYSHRRA